MKPATPVPSPASAEPSSASAVVCLSATTIQRYTRGRAARCSQRTQALVRQKTAIQRRWCTDHRHAHHGDPTVLAVLQMQFA
eukprot:3617914-Prymnesium_polylepis.1